MDIPFDNAWTVGAALVALGGAWFLTKRNADDIKEVWKVITKIRDWQIGHDKESGEKRLELERRISEVAAEGGRHKAQTEAQNLEMNRRLDSIDKKLDRLIENDR